MTAETTSSQQSTVGIILVACGHARYALEAFESALDQTKPANEIVFVDCVAFPSGPKYTSRYPNVHYIRCDGSDIASARNLGLAESKSDYLLFLNSNDVLRASAVETAAQFAEKRPDAEAILFDFEWTDETGKPAWPSGRRNRLEDDVLAGLLSGELVFTQSSILYRRSAFEKVGQFQPDVAAASDLDLLMRAASHGLLAMADAIIVKCRPTSDDQREMLLASQTSLRRFRVNGLPSQYAEMKRRGIARAEAKYGELVWSNVRSGVRARQWNGTLLRDGWKVTTQHPNLVLKELGRFVRHRAGAKIYGLATKRQKQIYHLKALARLQAEGADIVSRQFGFDRGQPVDRYYIEQFLEQNSMFIQGRVLEVKNNHYTKRFGGDRVLQSDVLHPDPNWPEATISGNLTDPSAFEAEVFDCFIFTQTLHLIYDVRAVLRTAEKLLKPGGVLLATAPCLSKIYQLNEPAHLDLDQDSWRLTAWSFAKLLSEFFPQRNVQVKAVGNPIVNTAFIYGLAVEDLPPQVLTQNDAENEMILLAKAVKPI